MDLPPKSAALKALGARIKHLRTSKGMTQLELAVKLNKDYQSIQRLERGATNPSFYYLLEVCEGLEVSFGELIGESREG